MIMIIQTMILWLHLKRNSDLQSERGRWNEKGIEIRARQKYTLIIESILSITESRLLLKQINVDNKPTTKLMLLNNFGKQMWVYLRLTALNKNQYLENQT